MCIIVVYDYYDGNGNLGSQVCPVATGCGEKTK